MDVNCSQCAVRKDSIFKNAVGDQLNCAKRYRHSQLTFPARSTVYEENEHNHYIYTLYSGWGAVYKTSNNTGSRQILRFLLPGDLTGYQGSTDDIMPHSVSTVTNAVFCVYPREKVKPMLLENPEIAVRFIEMWSRDLSLCQNHLMAVGRKKALESITFLLLELFHRARQQIPDSYEAEENAIDFPLTQQDIGDAVGMTKIHVNRVMKSLTNDGLICYHKKKLAILDEEKLRDIAGFSPAMLEASSPQ